METRPAEADQGKTLNTIGRDRLHRLLAIWSMLSGVPEDALRCQTETMFGLEGEDADNPVRVHAAAVTGMQECVVIVESQWPNDAFLDGIGINVLVSAEPGYPAAGAAYHDTAVWLRASG